MATGHPQGGGKYSRIFLGGNSVPGRLGRFVWLPAIRKANIVGFSWRESGAGKPEAGRVLYGYRPSVRGWQIFSDFPGPNPDDGVGFWLPTGGPRRNPPGGGES